jgi:hypothetical protein
MQHGALRFASSPKQPQESMLLISCHCCNAISLVGRALAWGAADRYLGMLAATAGDLSAAEEYYNAALNLEKQLDAPPFLARTRWWHARMLLTRKAEGDRERAREMLDQTIETASELGMNRLLIEAQELGAST